MSYWGFRIDVDSEGYPDFYVRELREHGVLRQGWGYDKSQNLRTLDVATRPREQRANLRMFESVKKGDIILIPRIPDWESVTIARATEDWDKGYRFDIHKDFGDYGHQFPAEKSGHFHRQNQNVAADVRTTLKCRSRFWDMSDCADSVEDLVRRPANELISDQDWDERFTKHLISVVASLNDQLGTKVHRALSKQFAAAEWEYALVAGLSALFPNHHVEKTSGPSEAIHGTDILITMSGPLPTVSYGIALQVKDWQGTAEHVTDAVEQVKKADEGWKPLRDGLRIIEKIVVLTGEHVGDRLPPEIDGVTILKGRELKELLRRMAMAVAANLDK